jgi:menaquinone-dependent protoporphyrinogen IX oxidase
MTCRSCFHLALICVFWLSANAIALGQDGNGQSPSSAGQPETIKRLKILVAYQSKYGSTKQYAEWIQKDTEADGVNLRHAANLSLAAYDIIIIGGYIRAGEIVVAPFIRENWEVLKTKKVILFTTSGTPPRHPNIRTIYEKSLPGDIRDTIRYFPLPGRISVEELTFWDKRLIAIGKMLEQDEALKEDMGRDFDGVRRENLSLLLDCINEFNALLIRQ